MCSNRKVKGHMKIFSSVSKFCVYGSNTSKNFFIAKRKNHFDVMNVIPLLQKKYLNTTYFQCLHILQYMQMIRVFVCFIFSIIIDNFLLIYLFIYFFQSVFFHIWVSAKWIKFQLRFMAQIHITLVFSK